MIVDIQAMGVSSFVAGLGLLIFPYINSLVRPGEKIELRGGGNGARVSVLLPFPPAADSTNYTFD